MTPGGPRARPRKQPCETTHLRRPLLPVDRCTRFRTHLGRLEYHQNPTFFTHPADSYRRRRQRNGACALAPEQNGPEIIGPRLWQRFLLGGKGPELSLTEAAAAIGVSVSRASRLITEGKLLAQRDPA